MNAEKKRPAWWTPDASEAKSSRGEGLPTLEELVDAKPLGSRFLEESDGSLVWVNHIGPGQRSPEDRAKTAWQMKCLKKAGIDYFTMWRMHADYDKDHPDDPRVDMIYSGPFILRPRSDPRGCVPASIFKALACHNALDGEEPVVTTYEAEWLFGHLVGVKLDICAREYYQNDEDSDDDDCEEFLKSDKFGAAAEAIIDDAITTVDDLRDPRQRGRPSFAGCGRYDGTPGTFEVGDSAHKGCPELDMSEPLLPKSPFRHWDAMDVFKEY